MITTILEAIALIMCAVLFPLVLYTGMRHERGALWCGRCGHQAWFSHPPACPICGRTDWRGVQG